MPKYIKERTAEAAKELLRIAKRDFRELTEGNIIADDNFGFFAQQAVEKSLKSWITAIDKDFDFTHNLEDLFEQLVKYDKSCKQFSELVFLTPFSVEFRYREAGWEAKLDRIGTVGKIKALIAQVEKIIVEQNK